MNISGLLSALPITGIEAQWLARIEGIVPDKAITLFEPPAGQHVLYIKAIETIAILLEHAGIAGQLAADMAKALYAELTPDGGIPEVTRTPVATAEALANARIPEDPYPDGYALPELGRNRNGWAR